MAEQIIVPKLGMASATVTLLEWKANEGDWVEQGATVLDIEAEKTAFEMTATASGYLHVVVAAGVEADVSTVVGLLAATQEEYAALAGDAPTPSAPATSATATATDRVIIAPIARKLALEHGIDPATIVGTGPGGRIQKRDVEDAIAAGEAEPAPQVQWAPDDAPPNGEKTAARTLPYTGMRKAIGENMMRSLQVNAPNTMSGEFDLTVLARYREHYVAQERTLGVRITYSDLLIHAVAKALREFPLLNSSLVDGQVTLWNEINIGMAVALGDRGDEGLLVPVVHGADTLSLTDLARTTKRLGERARARQLTPAETSGGTFTVTNFGSLGVSASSTPIINPPESAIIGFGRVQDKPVVRNGAVVVAPMLPYSLTHDHRVIDGAAAEYFLAHLKALVEVPGVEQLAP